jgi:hypothetical protein
MKIEESFKDLKSLLNLEKLMNKGQEKLEKMIALVLLAYAIGLLVGEALRDRMYQAGEKMEAILRPLHTTQATSKAG